MTGDPPLFAADLALVELFLGALKDRKVDLDGEGRVVLVPETTKRRALADEVRSSVRWALFCAHTGARQRWDADGKMLPPMWMYACDSCRSWTVQTVQRSKTKCSMCGAKGPRRKLDIPWADASRGRPRQPKPKRR